MAQTQTIRISIKDRVLASIEDLTQAYRRQRVYSHTVAELSALSDRDLSDMGLHRSMIRSVARQAAYGK